MKHLTRLSAPIEAYEVMEYEALLSSAVGVEGPRTSSDFGVGSRLNSGKGIDEQIVNLQASFLINSTQMANTDSSLGRSPSDNAIPTPPTDGPQSSKISTFRYVSVHPNHAYS